MSAELAVGARLLPQLDVTNRASCETFLAACERKAPTDLDRDAIDSLGRIGASHLVLADACVTLLFRPFPAWSRGELTLTEFTHARDATGLALCAILVACTTAPAKTTRKPGTQPSRTEAKVVGRVLEGLLRLLTGAAFLERCLWDGESSDVGINIILAVMGCVNPATAPLPVKTLLRRIIIATQSLENATPAFILATARQLIESRAWSRFITLQRDCAVGDPPAQRAEISLLYQLLIIPYFDCLLRDPAETGLPDRGVDWDVERSYFISVTGMRLFPHCYAALKPYRSDNPEGGDTMRKAWDHLRSLKAGAGLWPLRLFQEAWAFQNPDVDVPFRSLIPDDGKTLSRLLRLESRDATFKLHALMDNQYKPAPDALRIACLHGQWNLASYINIGDKHEFLITRDMAVLANHARAHRIYALQTIQSVLESQYDLTSNLAAAVKNLPLARHDDADDHPGSRELLITAVEANMKGQETKLTRTFSNMWLLEAAIKDDLEAIWLLRAQGVQTSSRDFAELLVAALQRDVSHKALALLLELGPRTSIRGPIPDLDLADDDRSGLQLLVEYGVIEPDTFGWSPPQPSMLKKSRLIDFHRPNITDPLQFLPWNLTLHRLSPAPFRHAVRATLLLAVMTARSDLRSDSGAWHMLPWELLEIIFGHLYYQELLVRLSLDFTPEQQAAIDREREEGADRIENYLPVRRDSSRLEDATSTLESAGATAAVVVPATLTVRAAPKSVRSKGSPNERRKESSKVKAVAGDKRTAPKKGGARK